jgi:hypothetical protein
MLPERSPQQKGGNDGHVRSVLALNVVAARNLRIAGTPARTASKPHVEDVTQVGLRSLVIPLDFGINNVLFLQYISTKKFTRRYTS